MQIIKFKSRKEKSYAMRESLRTLKTNIQFCGDDIKTILFTSSAPDEGKSTVTMDLAESFTDSKKKVLVIDTDMRKSVLVNRTGAKLPDGGKIYGLSHFLTGQKGLSEVLYAGEKQGMFVIFAGPSVPNPTELLDNRYFKELMEFARENFDYVLVDCPPIGAAIDAAIVAKYCDGAVLVIAQGQVSGRVISGVKKQLEASGVRILGAVLNKVDMSKSKRYGYYGNYYGNYYNS